jgi:hypothetical protein
MPVAVYKLRIRERPGDDTAWREAHVAAGSAADALAQARQRFGEELVMAIGQDVGEPEPATEEGPAAHGPAPAIAGDAGLRDAAVACAPMPWEGRWRPSILVWSGVGAGMLMSLLWLQFGESGRERFVTSSTAPTTPASGLALDQPAPSGGVLAATGLRVRPGRADAADPEAIDEAVAEIAEAADVDAETAGEIRDIGNLVGDMFARHRVEPAPPADAPPDGSVPQGEADAPPPPATREPSVLRPFFVEVERGDGSIETLRVNAYDADHARAIVSDLPERPVILHGPSQQLDW